jgi:uncharacterized membrane protein
MHPPDRLWTGLVLLITLLSGSLALSAPAAPAPATPAAGPPITLCFGLYTQFYRLPEALAGYQVTVCNARSDGVVGFPAPEVLARQAAVILSDVSGAEFSAAQLAQLQAYVQGGGGLLVLGGPSTFGEGAFLTDGLAAGLPVTLQPRDWQWQRDGAPLSRPPGASLGAALAADPAVRVYWLHQVTPRPGATVQLTAGPYPLLVTASLGPGRVAVFTGTPLGLPAPGQTPFWQAEGWPALLRETVAWLAGGRGAA